MITPIIRAAQFAAAAHAGQLRRYNGAPYITHPIRVAGNLAISPGATEQIVCVGYLHDTIEDCEVTYKDIAARFGSAIADVVRELTNASKGSNLSRTDRKKMDRDKIKDISICGKMVKLMDRIDNLFDLPIRETFAKKYAEESQLLLDDCLRGVNTSYERILEGRIKSILHFHSINQNKNRS